MGTKILQYGPKAWYYKQSYLHWNLFNPLFLIQFFLGTLGLKQIWPNFGIHEYTVFNIMYYSDKSHINHAAPNDSLCLYCKILPPN